MEIIFTSPQFKKIIILTNDYQNSTDFKIKHLTINNMQRDCIRFSIGRRTGEFARMVYVSVFNDERAYELATAPFGDPHATAWACLT